MFLYETHCHTSEVSLCSKITGRDLADFYKSIGYDGIFVTDHFFNGNCVTRSIDPDRSLSWEELVAVYCRGYEEAKKRGEEIGLKVFFGIEFSVKGCDFTAYGITPEWLLAHPDCDKLHIGDFIDAVHEAGGAVFQAHAFREANYIKIMRLIPWKVDGFEVFNAERTDFENKLASVFCDLYGEKRHLIRFAGSDNHVGRRPRLAAVATEAPVSSEIEFAKAVLAERHTLLKLSDEEGSYRVEKL